MFHRVILEIVIGNYIFNFNGYFVVVLNNTTHVCQTLDPTSNKGSKLQLDSSSMIKLNCPKSHTLWKCCWLWPCPIVCLDFEWLQNMVAAFQNIIPHVLWFISFLNNVVFLLVAHEFFEQICSTEDTFHQQVDITLNMYCHWQQNSCMRLVLEANWWQVVNYLAHWCLYYHQESQKNVPHP